MNVIAKVRAGDYTTKVPYPSRPKKPTLGSKPTAAEARAYADELEQWERDMELYHLKSKNYSEDQNKLYAQFRKDLEEEHDMTGHPFADRLYNRAYEEGHSSGLESVAFKYEDLAEFIQPLLTRK